MLLAIPPQHGLAEPGAGSDHGDATATLWRTRSLQGMSRVARNKERPVRQCFEIVHESHRSAVERERQIRLRQPPRQVGGM
jgi:hypothetical protein